MTDQQDEAAERREEALDELEEARADAAAIIVQRERRGDVDVGPQEERIVDAVEEAADEADPRAVEKLADQAEKARDEIRRELYGPGSEPDGGEPDE